MTTWRKHYVVGDGTAKDRPVPPSRPPRTPKPPKERRAGIRYSWVFFWMLMAFGGGLYLGLREDFEAEEINPQLADAIFGGEAAYNGVKLASIKPLGGGKRSSPKNLPVNIFANWEMELTDHFSDRLEERAVPMEDVRYVISHGYIERFWADHTFGKEYQPKFNLRAVTPGNRDILISFTVPVHTAKTINLITVIDNDDPRDR